MKWSSLNLSPSLRQSTTRDKGVSNNVFCLRQSTIPDKGVSNVLCMRQSIILDKGVSNSVLRMRQSTIPDKACLRQSTILASRQIT
ncbi:hypothetical protein RRG08_057431 [Elysia crispata]|uniref:Uncharacterized protein n=1 Tax=Elysia crispata TaxID=231223 RepID=A0AAE1DAC5_9GAST|nr:hypothetical protein RRG08_057431 [Elysia crispata]